MKDRGLDVLIINLLVSRPLRYILRKFTSCGIQFLEKRNSEKLDLMCLIFFLLRYWDFKAEGPQIWPTSGHFGLKIPIYGKSFKISNKNGR